MGGMGRLHGVQGFAVAGLELGQVFGGDGQLLLTNGLLFECHFTFSGHVIDIIGQLGFSVIPLRQLHFGLLNLRMNTRSTVHDVFDFGFKTRHFGIGFVQRRLCRMHGIGQIVVRGTFGFQLAFSMTQSGDGRFQFILRQVNFARDFGLFGQRFIQTQQPQKMQFVLCSGL